MVFLLRKRVSKLGQSAFLKYEHPSAPIWLLPIYLFVLYIGRGFVNWANRLYSDVSILQRLFDFRLNIREFFKNGDLG